jgi:DNA-binding LacI/PurR family transcriptional regulator
MRATIKDIARLAGVSTQTVSNVVNDRPVVGEATRRKVLEACRALSYTPNASARGLVTGSRKVIGLVVPHIGNPAYGDLIATLARIAGAAGYSVVVGDTGWNPEPERTLLSSLIRQSVDGVILASCNDHGSLQMLRDAGVPTVLLYNYFDGCDADLFRIDNFGAFRMVTRHLIALGHRRIGFVRGLMSTVVRTREDGWRSAMTEAGLDVGEDLVSVSTFDQNGGHAAVTALLAQAERPTAVVCTSDIMACGAMDAAADLGLDVPRDLAVTGFDDIFVAAMRRVRLTSLRYDRARLAQQAFDRLLQIVGTPPGHFPGPRQSVALPCELVVRASCGSPAGQDTAATRIRTPKEVARP